MATPALELRPGCLHLQELNSRSATVGKWDVGIFHSRIETWSVPGKSSGAALRCIHGF